MPGTELDHCELPLKRPKLGPPDIYKLEGKPREDDLNSQTIKEGFKYQPVVADEVRLLLLPDKVTVMFFFCFAIQFALAKDLCTIGRSERSNRRGLSMSTVGMSLSDIATRKSELCALQDTSKRRLQIGKDNFFLVHQKIRQHADSWLSDLALCEPLTKLIKSVPIFNKREEIFPLLFDHKVSPFRAAWYIKLVNLYYTQYSIDVSRRQMGGPNMNSGSGSNRSLKGSSDPCLGLLCCLYITF